MGSASLSEGGLRPTRVRVAELANLRLVVDAESLQVTMALHFAGAHDTTYASEALVDGQYCGDGTKCLAFGVLPVCLNVTLPCAVQVGKWDKPTLKTFPLPEPFGEDTDKN